MWVSDLNVDWIPHGPANREGRIPNEKMIEQIMKMGVKELYIDTDKGLDVNEGMPEPEVEEERQKMFDKAGELQPLRQERITVYSEFTKATKVHQEAKNIVDNALQDVKFGKPLQIDVVDKLSIDLVSSVFRNKDALLCLGRMRTKDSYLLEHSVNLSVLMTSFGKHIGLSQEILQQASVGALLHDIGKILVPDEILLKPGKLSAEEFEHIKKHVVHSREILTATEGISDLAVTVACQHHERFDGTGYPDGLKGEEISEYGRMVAIVDVYDAITADRCYHKGIIPSAALKKLLEWSGSHFDVDFVHKFIRCIGIYPVASLVRLESGKLAIVMQQNEEDQRLPEVKVIYDAKHQHYVSVKNLNLAKSQDTIVGVEDPAKYNIDIKDFIELPC